MKLIKKNKGASDCGVVAAFNAASWCNVYRTYADVEKLARSCGYGKSGIYPFQFSYLLKKLGIPVKKVKPKSLDQLESNIYTGKFYCILYTPAGFSNGHVVSVFMDHKGNIRVINPVKWLTWNELAAEMNAHGMVNIHLYEVPHRQLVKKAVAKHDV
jgi:Peptidase C39 family